MEAATEALADRTPEEAVLMQEEMNLRELGRKPLAVPLLLLVVVLVLVWPFFIVREYRRRPGTGSNRERGPRRGEGDRKGHKSSGEEMRGGSETASLRVRSWSWWLRMKGFFFWV